MYDYDIDLETADVRIEVGAHISRRMRALGFVLPIIPMKRVMMEQEWVRVIVTISSKQQQIQLDSKRITLRDSGGGELSPESTSFDDSSGVTGGSTGCDFEEHDGIAIVRAERTCDLRLTYARRPRDIEVFDLQIEGMSAGGTPVPSLVLKMTKRSFPYSELGP